MSYKPKRDYLKYWRVIRHYVKAKYKLSVSDLDMLLFLFSERYFGKDDFNEYAEIMSWDPKRFQRLVTEGWIQKFRNHNASMKQKALYVLSHRCKSVISSIYEQLEGARDLSIDIRRNPMGAPHVRYIDKVYRNQIKKVNEEYKRLRRGED